MRPTHTVRICLLIKPGRHKWSTIRLYKKLYAPRNSNPGTELRKLRYPSLNVRTLWLNDPTNWGHGDSSSSTLNSLFRSVIKSCAKFSALMARSQSFNEFLSMNTSSMIRLPNLGRFPSPDENVCTICVSGQNLCLCYQNGWHWRLADINLVFFKFNYFF